MEENEKSLFMKGLEEKMEENKKVGESKDSSAETPPVETSSTETPPAKTGAPPVEKKDEYDFKSFGEEYDSPDKIKTALDSYSGLKKEKEEWGNQSTKWNDEKLKLEKELKENKSNIDDPILYRLNKIKKDNPDDYDLYKGIVLTDNVNALKAMTTKFIQSNSAYKDDYKKAERFIINKYGLDLAVPGALAVDDDGEVTQDMVDARNFEIKQAKEKLEFAEMSLNEDANNYKGSMLGKFNEIELPAAEVEKTQEERDTIATETKKGWSPFVEKVMTDVLTIPMPTGIKDEMFNYTIPDDKKQELKEGLMQYAVDNNLPLTKESGGKAYNFFVSSVISLNQADINLKLMQRGKNLADEEWEKITESPSALKESSIEKKEGGKSDYDSFKENMDKIKNRIPT